jgi:hypothetical protein
VGVGGTGGAVSNPNSSKKKLQQDQYKYDDGALTSSFHCTSLNEDTAYGPKEGIETAGSHTAIKPVFFVSYSLMGMYNDEKTRQAEKGRSAKN